MTLFHNIISLNKKYLPQLYLCIFLLSVQLIASLIHYETISVDVLEIFIVISKIRIHSPAGIYLLKVNNINTRSSCEICLKLTVKTRERHHRRRSDVFTVNFEHISHLVIVFLLLTLMLLPTGRMIDLLIIFIAEDFDQAMSHKEICFRKDAEKSLKYNL